MIEANSIQVESIVGDVSSTASLVGNVTANGFLSNAFIGSVNITKLEYPAYDGEYEITPRAEAQVLQTAMRTLEDDILIKEIPYFDVSNEYGRTIYIGGEINA